MKGSRNIWELLGTHPDINDDDETELLEISDLVLGLIVSIPQASGIKILQQNDRYVRDNEEEEDTVDEGLGGDKNMV